MSRGITAVETMGLEPTTPCLQSRCSSQLSYVPGLVALTCGLVPVGSTSRLAHRSDNT